MATELDFSPVQLSSSQGIGAFGLSILEDGGLVSKASIRLGYGRRNLEHLAETLPLSQALNFADRVDFTAAPAYNLGLANAFEELLGIDVPERAQQIRVILVELNRISNHLHYYANLARVVGLSSLRNHCLRERERLADIFEMYCGSRLGFGAICLGGVIEDASDGWFFRIEKALSSLKDFYPEMRSVLLDHPFFVNRARGLGLIQSSKAASWNLLGPNARASGVFYNDSRSQRPRGGYCRVRNIPIKVEDINGDVLSRSKVRIHEMQHSSELIAECFKSIPSGNHRIKVGIEVTPPPGKAWSEVEGPRGTILIYAEAAGLPVPATVRFLGPSSSLVHILPKLLVGIQAEDIFLVIQSLDISFSEVDK